MTSFFEGSFAMRWTVLISRILLRMILFYPLGVFWKATA